MAIFFEKKFNFRTHKWPQSSLVSRTIYDGQTFDKINPVWENWINRINLMKVGSHFYFCGNSILLNVTF